MVRAQELLIAHADKFDPVDLAEMARRVAELLDPEAAEEREAERLDREDRIASQERFLSVEPDHHGSMRIAGKVTPVVGATLLTQLDALMPSAASYKGGPVPSKAARRADALERLLGVAAATGDLPDDGGDRPRVIVTMSYDTLVDGIGHATLTATGEQVTRPMCGPWPVMRDPACGVGVGVAALGCGRENRTIPKPMRMALNLRDKGCVFRGCDVGYAACDAHHTVPWWAGGATKLTNLALLCSFHHRVAEPDPNKSPEYQWLLVIDPEDGLPVLYPPVTIDPQRRPLRHKRHEVPGKVLPPLHCERVEPKVRELSAVWRLERPRDPNPTLKGRVCPDQETGTEPLAPRGGAHRVMPRYLISRYSSRPSWEPSRPRPDCFTPRTVPPGSTPRRC
ncbi:HNH endonuclease signature motif containing protein [Tessaracoccus coleopterorum]|uniref:HNH endonuclease signature motif containing protein n=1 Tax=Tessaracoccus coleopterorum TaxID=2714950 RepID=UPI002F9133A6